MKNIIKLSLLTIILAFATSCDVDQTGARFLNGNRGVSFDNAKYRTTIDEPETKIYIHVARVSASMAETIGLTHDSQYPDIFTIPQTVSFTQGEYEKNIEIHIDISKMMRGKNYVFNLKLEEKTSFAGVNTTEITVSRPLPWIENIGYSTYISDWYGMSADSIPTDSVVVGTEIWYRLREWFYYLDPDPDYVHKGYDLVFIVDMANNISVPETAQNTGSWWDEDGYAYFNFISATKTDRTVEFQVKYDLPEVGAAWSTIYTETVILP
ncbi:MAG: hypothetical protein LBP85_10935 [Prevotellaceae bacterium]|jgi:hypothetical protein|nr:hypothetical protein [Prevotellaceae bacterium]